ncbi:MAG: hypothetical protein GF421_03080 [Candidatus Aminicenantes bacterium]|nr:hypothetical protein [Candidatus Aminicenantes bacterium]
MDLRLLDESAVINRKMQHTQHKQVKDTFFSLLSLAEQRLENAWIIKEAGGSEDAVPLIYKSASIMLHILLEYYFDQNHASVTLYWDFDSLSKKVVPNKVLYPQGDLEHE